MSPTKTCRGAATVLLRPLAEIDDIVRQHDADRSQRVGQRELAREMTAWVHERGIARVEEASRVMFGGSLDGVQEPRSRCSLRLCPSWRSNAANWPGASASSICSSRTVAESKSAARRLVQQGGAYVNNVRVADSSTRSRPNDLVTPTMLVVRGGRKDYRLVRLKG